jgi:hypothetical protein
MCIEERRGFGWLAFVFYWIFNYLENFNFGSVGLRWNFAKLYFEVYIYRVYGYIMR